MIQQLHYLLNSCHLSEIHEYYDLDKHEKQNFVIIHNQRKEGLKKPREFLILVDSNTICMQKKKAFPQKYAIIFLVIASLQECLPGASESQFCLTDENNFPENHRVILEWIYHSCDLISIQMRCYCPSKTQGEKTQATDNNSFYSAFYFQIMVHITSN